MLVYEQCDPSVLKERSIKELTGETISTIRRVTARMDTLPVGTFKYKIFKYPGDIDIFEKLEVDGGFAKTKLITANMIHDIVFKISQANDVIFAEFKAGYDRRYKLYIGGSDDYYPKVIRRDITNLYESGLLYPNEYNELISLVKDNYDDNAIRVLEEKLRNYWVIRWTKEEVLQGHKTLRGNYKLYLDDAMTHGSIVKLDTIGFLRNSPEETMRYVEVTNFFLIVQKDKYGNEIILSEELKDYESSLLSDVYKYYPSNRLKSIKRLWMYLAFKNKICELNKFTPLFSSNISLYSQLLADIETGIYLLSSNLPYNPKLLFDSLNQRLKLLNGLCVSEPLYSNVNSSDFNIISNNLEILKHCLQNKINNMVDEWLLLNHIDLNKIILEK